jgi:integrase
VTLPELLATLERRADEAEEGHYTAPVDRILRQVIIELQGLEVADVAVSYDCDGASRLLGVKSKTVANWCKADKFPGARKTGGSVGWWQVDHSGFGDPSLSGRPPKGGCVKRKQHARMYHREGRGWYGDFRNFAAEGGAREALKPEGARHATTDQSEAARLYSRRLDELQAIRDGRVVRKQPAPVPTFADYLERHLERKALRVRPETLRADRRRLEALLPRWGELRLTQLTAQLIADLALELRAQDMAPQTVNHTLSAVSSLLGDAVLPDGYLPANPAAGVKRLPIHTANAAWLESAEGYRLLVAGAELDREHAFKGVHCLEALIGTALLTGGRRDELFTLLVQDVDFNASLIQFRPNSYYPVRKSRHATRVVPLWPQLRRILVPYIGDRAGGLLFPGGKGRPLHSARGSLDKVFKRADLKRPAGKAWHLFRHTYTAMRLQTLDHGAPVSVWTVKEELGHGSVELIEQTYGHLLKQRQGQRLSTVEYRPVKLAEERTA